MKIYNENISDSAAIDIEKMGDSTFSRARAYLSGGDQTINDSTLTLVHLNTESYDNLGEFDSTTNYRFTATTAGYYLVCTQVFIQSLPDASRAVSYVYKNGSTIMVQTTITSGNTNNQTISSSDVIYLAANDYIDLRAWHNGGSSLVIGEYERNTYMAVHKLS